MYVWRGNPQCHCHRLNSTYFIVLRNTVHHLILGSQLILWELLTLHLQRFLTGSHSSPVACWDWSHRHITRPNHNGVMGEKFDPAATKSVILLLFYSLMWPPWKQFMGRCLLNGLAWQTTASVEGQNEVTRWSRTPWCNSRLDQQIEKAATEMLVLF